MARGMRDDEQGGAAMLIKIEVETHRKTEMVDISSEVKAAVARSGVRAGWCIVWVPHTTAGLTVNENADPAVKKDLLAALDRLVPSDGRYEHSEGNSPGHIKSTLCGHGATLIVDGGEPVLGTWQGIYFMEFDGPRRRRALVKVVEG